jgi:hypothetical protein
MNDNERALLVMIGRWVEAREFERAGATGESDGVANEIGRLTTLVLSDLRRSQQDKGRATPEGGAS